MAQNNTPQKAATAGARGGPGNRTPARIVFLNALPLNALPRRHLGLDVLPVGNIYELGVWVQRRLQEGFQLVHYIRHPATIAVLKAIGIPLSEQTNSGLYVYQPNDVIVVVTTRGQEQTQVSPQELEAWIVAVL
ncbi:MAG: hypothetical protein QW680_11995 [Pyrobaculum sp.]